MRLSHCLIFVGALSIAAAGLCARQRCRPGQRGRQHGRRRQRRRTCCGANDNDCDDRNSRNDELCYARACSCARGFPWGVLGILGLIGLFGVRKVKG